MTYIEAGSREYKLAKIAFLIAGLVTFAVIYTTQPTMPVFAEEFQVSAPGASLSLSLTTGLLAISMLLAATLSDRISMKTMMVFSMVSSSILGLLTAFSPNFTSLLLLRAFLGILVAGVPSIAMAFIGKEFHPKDSIMIMGFYISGSTIGGMSGRILTGVLTDLFSWRIALGTIGVIALILSIIFWYTLPNPKNQIKKSINWSTIWPSYKMHLMNGQINFLFILGFLLMGSFVSMYNYISFRLMQPPYNLNQAIIGFIFIVYLFGTFSSVYMGKKANQYGSSFVLKVSFFVTIAGAFMTIIPHFILKMMGLGIFTFGFFASHSIVSSLVTKRAPDNKAQASSLYLLFYYLGSSVLGTIGGYFWEHFAWAGVIIFNIVLLTTGLLLVILREKSRHTSKVHHEKKAL